METHLTINDSLETCKKFCKFIEKSFGPRGELSFIMSCTGQGSFTTSGMTIIEKVHSLHPVARIILQSLQKYHDCIGDGSKNFVLLLREIFFQILEHENGSNFTNHARIKLINSFSFLLNKVLPDCFVELRYKISDLTKEPIKSQKEDTLQTILYLLNAFFCGKFGHIVSECLSDLVHHLLIKHSGTWKSVSLGIKYTLDNFGILCTSGNMISLSESQIIPGVVLSREFTAHSNSKMTEHLQKFIVVDNTSDETLDTSFNIKNNQELYTLVENEFSKLQVSMEQKRQVEISLIICAGKVSDHVKSTCRQYGVQLVTMVPMEEIHYLLWLSQIQPVHSFTGKISSENCGTLSFIKTVRIKNKDCVHLGLKCKQTDCFPYHLVMNGPSDRICKQYLKEMWNSLKLIYVWEKDNDRYSHACNGDGIKRNCEEKSSLNCVDVKLVSQNVSQHVVPQNKIEYVDSCKHIDLEFEKSCFNLSDLCTNISKSSFYATICPAGGCWELCLYHTLVRKNLSNPDLVIACKILSKALIIIPRMLYENNCCKQNHFPHIWKLITERLQLNEICFLDKWGEVQAAEVADTFEPVIAKEILVCQVVQLVIQLIRLQSIV